MKVCSKCQSNRIDDSGLCLACGFKTEAEVSVEKMEFSQNSTPVTALPRAGARSRRLPRSPQLPADPVRKSAELPEWRQELMHRLQKLKDKRESENGTKVVAQLELPNAGLTLDADSTGSSVREVRSVRSARKTGRAKETRPSEPAEAEPQPKAQLSTPLFLALEDYSTAEFPSSPPPAAEPNEQISPVIAAASADLIDVTLQTRVPEPAIIQQTSPDTSGDRFILLSRTLSGLIDLIIVIVCGSSFILTADVVSGIRFFDLFSLIHYILLSISIFFLYSLFFLGTANQTVGMMITNLRLTGAEQSRPDLSRIFIRCAVYLVSLLGLGLGLIAGLFNRDSDCLQDRVSRTRVVRLSWPEAL